MMRPKLEAEPEAPVARDRCRHHWIIESPSGPTSRGVCKLCGAEKEFRNSLPDAWEKDDASTSSEPSGLPEIKPNGEPDDS